MLPNPNHVPSTLAQNPVVPPITGLVRVYLPTPILRIGLRPSAVFRATVPEAAVDKNGQADRGQDEVRAAGQRLVTPPARDVGGAQDGREFQLCVLVAAGFDGGHDLAALYLCENVGHAVSALQVAPWRPGGGKLGPRRQMQTGSL